MREPSPGGTRVLNTCRGESRGFYKLAEPLVVRLTDFRHSGTTHTKP
jgi:hypothetical protein